MGNIYGVAQREEWLGELKRSSVRERVKELYGNLDDLAARRDRIRKRLQRTARRHPVTKRFLAIPGYGPIRSLTFLVMVDTPYRFSTPQKLWRYSGLASRREQSGDPGRVRMVQGQQYNRRLKAVARKRLSVPWAMWKNQTEYTPALVTVCEPVRPGTGVPRGRELRR